MSVIEPDALPTDHSELINEIMADLSHDRGHFLQGADLSRGLPDQIDASGTYGRHGPVAVSVYGDGLKDDVLVVSSAQAELRQDETLSLVRELITRKDVPANDYLLISLMVPDARGFTCPPDLVLWRHIQDAVRSESLLEADPQNLKGLAIHVWGTNFWVDIQVTGCASPWQ